MVATVPSDSYSIFMRKIGYSVGLENTLQRVHDLESMYLRKRDVTAASWRELVRARENWNLGSDNITDVFSSLRLVQRVPGDILVLENLDALAIANCLLAFDEHDGGCTGDRSAGRAFLLLWAILVNDGEIFVNMLLAGFDREEVKTSLRKMMLRKRASLARLLRSRGSIARIQRTITIERQEKNRGSARGPRSIASLRRTEPLERHKRRSLRPSEDTSIALSADYLRKVPPRRRDWARSLDLWDDEVGLTSRGKKFIAGLRNTGYIDKDGSFIYWPMDYELERAGFRRDLLGDDTKGLWNCLLDFGSAYAELRPKTFSQEDVDKAVALIREVVRTFRMHHVRKAMLRREVPITTLYPAAVAYACARRRPIIDLPAAIAAEQRSETRRISLRRSRNTGGALSLMGEYAGLTAP